MESWILLGPAFVLGVLHAFEPGHGKTAIIGYLIGSRAGAESAFALGSANALTHGFSIFIIATLITATTQAGGFDIHDVLPWISRLSGGSIILLAGYVWWKERQEDCCPTKNISLSEMMKKRTRWEQARFSFVLGVGGGLIPCPAALASYVTALGAGNTQQGIWGIFVFSIGIFLSVSLMTWLLLKTSGRWLRPGNSRLTQFVLYARLILMVSTGLYLIFLSEVPHVHA